MNKRNIKNETISPMGCPKCVGGIIMKQIRIADFMPEPCDCSVEHWFKGLKH
jgi:hypothetical protein